MSDEHDDCCPFSSFECLDYTIESVDPGMVCCPDQPRKLTVSIGDEEVGKLSWDGAKWVYAGSHKFNPREKEAIREALAKLGVPAAF